MPSSRASLPHVLPTVPQVVSDGNTLAAWITIDLLYEADVAMVVIANGESTFDNDLVLRWAGLDVARRQHTWGGPVGA